MVHDQIEAFNRVNRMVCELRTVSDQVRKNAIIVAQNQTEINSTVSQLTLMIQDS
jgi:D-Tyr-tRNAtyr deacylase